MRDMPFASLWCLCTHCDTITSQVCLQSRFERQTAFCLQPFSLLLNRCWNSFWEKKKSKKCTTVMLRWKTGLTDTNSNMWNTLKVFAHTSSTNAMQWDMIHDGRPRLRVTKRGWSRLPETHYMTLPLLPYIVFFFSLVHTGSQRLAAVLFECRNTRRWKIIWNHFILSVRWFHFCRKVTDRNISLKWHAVRLTGGALKHREDTERLYQQPCLHRTP